MAERSGLDLVKSADLKVLAHLRRNARETLTTISKDTGIPISTVFDRLRALEETRVIRKHTSIVDLRKLGIRAQLVLLLKGKESDEKELESWLEENPYVNNLTRVNGDWHYVAEMYFRNIRGIEDFVDKLCRTFDNVRYSVLYVIKDLKREAFSMELCAPMPRQESKGAYHPVAATTMSTKGAGRAA